MAEPNALADLLGAAVQQTENTTPQTTVTSSLSAKIDQKPIELDIVLDTSAPPVVVASTGGNIKGSTAVPNGGAGFENPLAGFKMAPKYASSNGSGQSRSAAPAAPTEEDEPAHDEFEDEELTLEIGSAAVRGKDEFDDEFDDDFDVAPQPVVTVPLISSPSKASADVASAAAEVAEADRRALHEAAETARKQAEAARAEEATRAAAEAAAAQSAAQAERMAALKRVSLAAESVDGTAPSAVDNAAPAAAIEAKSKAELADEKYAASLRSLRSADNTIAEDEEEEEEEEEEESPEKPTAVAMAAANSGRAPSAMGASGTSSAPAPPPAPPRMPTREERLEAQFAEATAAADASKLQGGSGDGQPANPDEDRKAKVTYVDACRKLVDGLSGEAMAGIVPEDWSGASFILRVVPALRPKFRSAELRQQRDNLFGLARTPMDRGKCYRPDNHALAHACSPDVPVVSDLRTRPCLCRPSHHLVHLTIHTPYAVTTRCAARAYPHVDLPHRHQV